MQLITRGTMDGKTTVELPTVSVVQQVQLTHCLCFLFIKFIYNLHRFKIIYTIIWLQLRCVLNSSLQFLPVSVIANCYCCYWCSCSFQADPNESHSTRKHVIIGVTCAVVTAMVITGLLVGVKFSLDNAVEIVKVLQRASCSLYETRQLAYYAVCRVNVNQRRGWTEHQRILCDLKVQDGFSQTAFYFRAKTCKAIPCDPMRLYSIRLHYLL